MEEKNTNKKRLITIETAINYAKASIYALQKSANGITAKDIDREMKMHYDRYDDKMAEMLVRAYEREEKSKSKNSTN